MRTEGTDYCDHCNQPVSGYTSLVFYEYHLALNDGFVGASKDKEIDQPWIVHIHCIMDFYQSKMMEWRFRQNEQSILPHDPQ